MNSGKVKLILFIVLRAIAASAAVFAVISGDWSNFALCVLTLLTLFLPTLIEKRLSVDFPNEFEIIAVIFIFSSIYLGEVKSFYIRVWWWDIFLHSFSGIIIGAIGFSLVYILNRHKNVAINLSPVFVSIFSFSFTLAIGALWEIYEFAMDSLFGMNMQKSGLVDTMWDLIFDSIGALVFSILGYLYLTGKIRIVEKLTGKFTGKGSGRKENRTGKKES